MKNLAAILVTILAIAVAGSVPRLFAQSRPGSLQGVWQTVDVSIGGSNPQKIAVSDPRVRIMILTASHYSRTEIQSDGPRAPIPDVAKATADELRAVWGPVVAEAGSYEISGETLTLHPQASKSPAAMAPGAFIVCTFKIEGNTLTITQVRNQAGPYPSPATFKLTRIE